MRRTRPIIPIDPGWLFVVSGLVVLLALVLLPPQTQLHAMQQDVEAMRAEERLSIARLRAYSDFLTALESGDPVLTRRLAAAQLNLVREGDVPVLVADSASAPVTEWIEATIAPEPIHPRALPQTRLRRMVTGKHRNWLLGGAVACLFIGLLVGGRSQKSEVRGQRSEVGSERSS